jgi:integrase
MIYKKKQLPKYCLHKSSGRAFVRIGGKTHYLGKHGSQASQRAYDRIITEFLANGRQPLVAEEDVLVESLVHRFTVYLDVEYKCCEGTKERLHRMLKLLGSQYGQLPILNFTPTVLKTIRREFLEKGFCRNTINNYIGIIRQIFCWGCEEEIVPAEIAGALRMVRSLQQGRSAAIDYEDVQPVNDDVVEKTLQYIKSPQICDMIRLQRLIGGRPQDIRNMRFCDMDRSSEIWKYTPYTHKSAHRGKKRELSIGPKAQQILQKYGSPAVLRIHLVN